MPSGWKKDICQDCIDNLVKNETTPLFKHFMDSMKKETRQTQKSFKPCAQYSGADPIPSTSSTSTRVMPITPSIRQVTSDRGIPKELEESLELALDSNEEECEDKPNKKQRFLFPSEETDELLKAIFDTLEPEDKELCVHDLICRPPSQAGQNLFG